MRCSRWHRMALAVTTAALLGAPAQADFLGLTTGDVMDSVNFNIPVGGAAFTDSANTLDIDAVATDIELLPFAVLFDIAGGAVDIRLDVGSESLTHVFGTFFSYTATLTGRAGVSDVSIFAPTGGPAPEQDGRLLVEGEISGPAPVLSVFFDSTFATLPTFTIAGTFAASGGDAQFLQAWGGEMALGSLANILANAASSIPTLDVLLADGHLFSVRDVNLATCAGGGDCVGTVLDQTGSWTASGGGSISPQSSAGFAPIPEPGTFVLMGAGLVGLAFTRRSSTRERVHSSIDSGVQSVGE